MEYFLVNLHGSGPSFFITIQLVFFFQLLNKQEHSPQKLESNVLWASAKQLVLKVLRRRYNLQTITNDAQSHVLRLHFCNGCIHNHTLCVIGYEFQVRNKNAYLSRLLDKQIEKKKKKSNMYNVINFD